MKRRLRLIGALVGLSLLAAACGSGGADLEELNVAYFEEWPTANQVAQLNETYDEVLGIPVNWISFASGNDMTLAMEGGEIDISYSQGLTPWANAVTGGSELEMVGIAVSYADADNCILAPGSTITQATAKELEGQKIYTPIGNVTHFKLLKVLDALGVDATQVELIPSEGGAAAVAAHASGDVAMACAFGGALNEMLNQGGSLLMTGAEQEALGIRVFDIISIPKAFGEEHGDVVTQFLQVTEDANRAYKADRASKEADIATAAGMTLESTQALLDAFSFPSKEEQLSADWLGGTAQAAALEQMQFFEAQGEIAGALGDYSQFVNTSFLEAVQ